MTDLSEILDTVRLVQPDDRAELAEIMWRHCSGHVLTPDERSALVAMRERMMA